MVNQFNLVSRSGLFLAFAILAGCQTLNSVKPDSYLAKYQDFPPDVKRFQVCHDVDCVNLTPITLDGITWQRLGNNFSVRGESAEDERHQIKSAIALFEEITGPIAKTQSDRARNDWGGWSDRQLDCIAETINTTTYLMLFEQQGWLKWHRVGFPKHRGLFSLQAPHNTAVIVENTTGRQYVVDSWFHKNGEQPEIVPVERWSAGYDPDDNN